CPAAAPPGRRPAGRPSGRGAADSPAPRPRPRHGRLDWPGWPRAARRSPSRRRVGCPRPAGWCAVRSWSALVECGQFARGRKREAEGGAAPGFAVRLGAPTMARQHPAHAGQADAGAGEFAGRVQALEYAEQLAGVLHVEAGAVVAHLEFVRTVVGLAVAHLDPGGLAAAAVL